MSTLRAIQGYDADRICTGRCMVANMIADKWWRLSGGVRMSCACEAGSRRRHDLQIGRHCKLACLQMHGRMNERVQAVHWIWQTGTTHPTHLPLSSAPRLSLLPSLPPSDHVGCLHTETPQTPRLHELFPPYFGVPLQLDALNHKAP